MVWPRGIMPELLHRNPKKEILCMNIILILCFYGIIINIAGFALMGIDKSRARRKAWRIPEARLFGVALLGGSAGSLLGMYYFRHKTRHWYFVLGMPAIVFLQLAALYLVWHHFPLTHAQGFLP